MCEFLEFNFKNTFDGNRSLLYFLALIFQLFLKPVDNNIPRMLIKMIPHVQTSSSILNLQFKKYFIFLRSILLQL